MTSYTYLFVNIACILIPFIFSFYPKHPFFKEWQAFFKANLLVAIVFLIWDYAFTDIGVWGFNESYLTGIFLGNLPLEEILFFICIPYSCVFTFFALQYIIKRNPFNFFEPFLSIAIIIISVFIAILNLDKWYTSTTFLALAIFLSILKFKKRNLSYHYLSYFAVLPFFVMSNGVLTGSFLVEPIVWYNDAENLGLRLFNIPVEDIFYGLLLIIMNIEFYLFFKHKKTAH